MLLDLTEENDKGENANCSRKQGKKMPFILLSNSICIPDIFPFFVPFDYNVGTFWFVKARESKIELDFFSHHKPQFHYYFPNARLTE